MDDYRERRARGYRVSKKALSFSKRVSRFMKLGGPFHVKQDINKATGGQSIPPGTNQNDKNMKKRHLILLFSLVAGVVTGHAQQVAVKTNLLYGAATLTPNLGAEVGVSPRLTLDLSVGYNPWNLKGSEENNRKLVHVLVQPELRYWPCERFIGHFFGVHALVARYNIGERDIPLLFEKAYRYEGTAAGAGVSYGYHLALDAAWGLEFTLGVGYVYLTHDQYECPKCGTSLGTSSKHYFGPTKAGVSLVYILK
jgi:hypothetical protein